MDPVLASAIFVLGLAFGSFLNVCIYRLPRDLSVVRPRSACPGCQQLIAAYDNIPVLSWLILRGRCRNCKITISPRYLIVELLTGAIFLACYAHFGASLATLKYCALGFLLLGLDLYRCRNPTPAGQDDPAGAGLGPGFQPGGSGE